MKLSFMEERMVQELQCASRRLYTADQHTKAAHVLSSALAYIRSLAASALESDPYDLTWKQIAIALKDTPQELFLLATLLLDLASCTGGLYAIRQEPAFRTLRSYMVRRICLMLSTVNLHSSV